MFQVLSNLLAEIMAKVARNPMKMINLIVYIQIDQLEKAFLRFYRAAVLDVKSQKMLLVSATTLWLSML